MSDSQPIVGVDPRLRHVFRILNDLPDRGPGAPAHPAGSIGTLSDGAIDFHGKYLSFVAPSVSALALNRAIVDSRAANSKREAIQLTESSSPWGSSMGVGLEGATALFDYFESYFAAALFSFIAIEAYCNEVMENFEHRQIEVPTERCGKRRNAKLEVRALERRSTDEKIGLILPTLLDLPTPKGRDPWPQYLHLRKVRNDIVHAKADDVLRRVQTEQDLKRPTLFFRAFNEEPCEFPKIATVVISYFARHWRTPTWLAHVRQETNLPPL